MKNLCPLCNSADTQYRLSAPDFFIHKGESELFEVHQCNTCTNAFTLPQLNFEALSKYYPSTFEAYTQKPWWFRTLLHVKYESDLRILKSEGENLTSVFEIGAGRGEFLAFLKEKQFKVSGAEPSDDGCKTASSVFHIDLQNVSAERIIYTQKTTVIMARHVLEHVSNPVQALTDAYQNGLADDGVLFLKVPNFDSWERKLWGPAWHGLDLPRHQFHFTKPGIIKILNQIGFKNVKVVSDVVPFDIIRSFKNATFLGAENKSFSPLQFVSNLGRLIASFAFLILKQKTSGRMIVLAKK